MAIYTVGNKTVGVPSIGGVIGGEWPEVRILSKDNIVSYHVTLPTKERYLSFVCDFISNKGIYGVWWNAYALGEAGMYDMGFTKRAPISTIGFFNTPILNLDLNITNRIKYVIDRGKNELLFYVNGTYIGAHKDFMQDGYVLDTYLDIYPLGLYFISEDESEEISISNASIFYCNDFSTAEKYAGTASSVRCVGALASDSPPVPVPVPPLPPTASDFIDVLTPAARVQGGTWSWDTYSGVGISARGEGKGQTGKWLENGTMSGGYPCVQMVRDYNTSGYPHGFIEWNASGLSGGLNPDINYYNKYLLMKMLWQPVRNCGQSTYVTGNNYYYTRWNLSIKLNDMETAKISAVTDGLQVVGTSQYGGDVYSFNKVWVDTDLDGVWQQTSTTGVHEFKQLLDLRSGGISSLFDNNYWTSKQYLYSPKYNNTNNFKLYVSASGPSAWEGVIPGDQTDWAVESVKLGGFGVSASKLDNISYNDFLSL